MNDYEYTFHQDIREKKLAATGAFHRATRGKRAFTVHNQSDYLTPKQRKELSSPVITFQDAPMSYETFRNLTRKEQEAYLNFIREKYNASCRAIAQMMGTNRNTLYAYLNHHGLASDQSRIFSQQQKEAWEKFCSHRGGTEEEIIEIPDNIPAVDPETPEKSIESDSPSPDTDDTATLFSINDTAAVFSTVNTIVLNGTDKTTLTNDIARALTFILPDHCAYKITIETI